MLSKYLKYCYAPDQDETAPLAVTPDLPQNTPEVDVSSLSDPEEPAESDEIKLEDFAETPDVSEVPEAPTKKEEEPEEPEEEEEVKEEEDDDRTELQKKVDVQPKYREGSREARLSSIGVPDEEIGKFKQLRNDQFNYFAQKLETLREYEQALPKIEEYVKTLQEGKAPASWHEHPEAYTLAPAYKAATASYAKISSEYDFWRQQLIKIEQGEPWEDLVQGADGKWTKVEREPTAQAKVEVQEYVGNASRLVAERRRAVEEIKTSFTVRHEKMAEGIKEAIGAYFPDYLKDTKAPVWKNIEGTFKYLDDNGFGNNLLSPLVAMLVARVNEQQGVIIHYQKGNKVAAAKTRDIKKAGPTDSNTISKSSSSSQEYSLDEFLK